MSRLVLVAVLLALMASLLALRVLEPPHTPSEVTPARLDAEDAKARWPALLAGVQRLNFVGAAQQCNCGLTISGKA